MCFMNILSAEDKVVRREDLQAQPRTQRLDSQPYSWGITLSSPLTQGEQLSRVLKSMVTWPGPGQSVCSALPGHCDWLRTRVVTNQGPGLGFTLESRGRGALCSAGRGGAGDVMLQQWEGREVGLGRLVTFLLQLGQSHRPEDEVAAEPRGWERRFLLWSRSSSWDLREAVCLWVLCYLSVNLFEPRWFSVHGLSGDHGNASVWVLGGFREEMPDDTGRLQFNLDSGAISSGQILILG